jgi:hypothetical protein
MANKVYEYEDLLEEYKQMFGKEPRITGIDWMRDPFDLLKEALETGIPINERPVPKGVVT